MFSAGQKVWHRKGQRSGTVVECDGDRVYIVQENGAELDFAASELTATQPDAPAPKPTDGKEPIGAAIPHRSLTPRDITPEHARVLAAIPVRTVRAIATLFERGSGTRKFSALDVAGKLNVIAEITAVPYRTMRQYSDRPGELGLLMGKGIADHDKP